MKIKNKHCSSLREFNKIERKYLKYSRRKNNNNIFNVWLSVDILDKELNSKYFLKYTKHKSNLEKIRNEVLNHIHQAVSYKNKTYFLRGIQITDEDYYYVYIANDNTKLLDSCVGGINY